MTFKQKEELLYKIYDNSDAEEDIKNNIDIIKKLSFDFFPQIRSIVAKICSLSSDLTLLEILLYLSKDSNHMVRVEVADSLCSFNFDKSYQKLIEMCDDPYYMVRGYAIYGIGVISNNDSRKNQSRQIIEHKLKSEKLYFNRLQCYMASYFLGDHDVLTRLFDFYPKMIYQNKCLILDFLSEILSKENEKEILDFLSEYQNCEIPIIAQKIKNII